MGSPIPPEKAETFLLYYIELKYRWLRGEISKMYIPLLQRAGELGFAREAAWRLIRFGRRVGMIES